MAKYIIEIDENDENSYPKQDIDIFVNRHKIINALNELSNLRRSLYKGYINRGTVIIKDNEVVIDEEGKKLKEYDIEGAKEYINTNLVIDKIDNILDDVNQYLD